MGTDVATSTAPLDMSLLSSTASVTPGGSLAIGGVDILDLAERFGTPLFVYDEEHLRLRCREAVAAFGPGVAYATKAFLCKAMARLAVEEGMTLDVSTSGELATAIAADVPPERLVLHGNNKSDAELTQALDLGISRIIVDSFDEISRLAHLSGSTHQRLARQPVMVRVTPGVEAHTHEYVKTGQEDSKFGFSLSSGAAERAAAEIAAIPGVELVGLHAHIGSQIFALDGYDEAIAVLAPLLEKLALPELCVGGGLGVAYVNGEQAPSITAWAERLRSTCSASGVPASVRLTAEPGRAIVASAALTIYRVGTIKDLPDVRTYVAVDGGMSDNPRPVLYGSGYEAFLPRAVLGERPLRARIVGKHCESGDVLVLEATVPGDIQVGDVLATPVTGAYGFSMASNYNRLPRPAVVFVAEGRTRVVVRRETDEDLLRLEP